MEKRNSTLVRKPYDNYKIYHPDGTLMCYCSSKKANWYLKRDLAKLKNNIEVHLTFEPNGYGDPTEILEGRKNFCVISGDNVDLTKHHVIPTQYRKHFNVKYKDKNSMDIAVLTRNIHNIYEDEATIFKNKLYVDYVDEEYKERINYLIEAQSKLKCLNTHYDKIPPAKQVFLQMRIEGICDKYNFNINELNNLPSYEDYNKIIVDIIGEVNLIVLWKLHFLKYGKPKFLPEWWKPNILKIINKTNTTKNKTELLKVDLKEKTLLTLIKKYELYDIASLYF